MSRIPGVIPEIILSHWQWMINNSVTSHVNDCTLEETRRAANSLIQDKSPNYLRQFMLTRDGEWRKWLDSDDVIDLSWHVFRAREQHDVACRNF